MITLILWGKVARYYDYSGSRAWQPTPVFLPEESHEERRLAGYTPWGCKESDMTVET